MSSAIENLLAILVRLMASSFIHRGCISANPLAELCQEDDTDEILARQASLEEEMNKISHLTLTPNFAVARDVVGSVFSHDDDYTHALANADDTNEQTAELCRNVENLANNFQVLLGTLLRCGRAS